MFVSVSFFFIMRGWVDTATARDDYNFIERKILIDQFSRRIYTRKVFLIFVLRCLNVCLHVEMYGFGVYIRKEWYEKVFVFYTYTYSWFCLLLK